MDEYDDTTQQRREVFNISVYPTGLTRIWDGFLLGLGGTGALCLVVGIVGIIEELIA